MDDAKTAEPVSVEPISWVTWDDTPRTIGCSKRHLVPVSDDEYESASSTALCGCRIPPEGNGIEYDEEHDGACKRCEQIAEREHVHIYIHEQG